MQFNISFRAFLILVLTSTILPVPAWSQSGRGRPKVQPPASTPAQPKPVTVPAATAVIEQEQAGSTSRFKLKNGMTVIISEQYATPIAAAVACFKTGTPSEPESSSGVARLLERLMFRGTTSRSAARLAADARALGAIIGASASEGGTAYAVVAQPDRMNDALAIQSDMLLTPLLDDGEMRREIQLIIEEEKRRDNPDERSMARLLAIAFDGSQAGGWKPINVEALRLATRDQLVAFYRKHYRPENLVIAVAGAAQTFNTLVRIQQLYGKFGAIEKIQPASGDTSSKPAQPTSPRATQANGPPATNQLDKASTRPIKPPAATQSTSAQQGVKAEPTGAEKTSADKPQVEGEQARLRYAADRSDINQSIVSVGFSVPGLESKEWPAIEVLATILGRGRASRLNRSLLYGQMVVNRIESDYLAHGNAGMLAVQMSLASGSIDKAESALFRELDGLRRELPGEADMARAKTLLEKRFVDRNSSYLSQATAIARAECLQGNYRAALDYRNRIRAVTAGDVQRAAARYITLANTSVHEHQPLSTEPRTFNAESFTTTVRAWASTFDQPVEGKPARAADDPSIAVVPQGAERTAEQQAMLESIQPLPIKDYSTLNGPRAFVREDRSQPKVTIALLFQGGRIVEDETTSGTTELMLRSLLYGTPRRMGAQVANELDQLGADVEIVVEPDFFGFTLDVLSRNSDRALKLLRDCVEEPAFRDEDIGRARLAQIAAIRDARDSSSARSRELLYQALFPGHCYSLPAHGREEVVSKLASEQLQEWYARAIKRQQPLAIIVGDTSGSALVSGQLAEGFRRRDLDRALQVKTPQSAKPSEKSEQRRRELTTVAIGYGGPKADSSDLTAIALIEAAMNGRGGRLHQELGVKQSLALDAELNDEAMFAAGAVYAQMITTPENEQRARAALLGEFERLARSGLSADEMASSRLFWVTRSVSVLQSQHLRALEYARAILYQRQASEVDALDERLSKVTAEDIKRAASAYFKSSLASAGIVRGTASPATQPSRQN